MFCRGTETCLTPHLQNGNQVYTPSSSSVYILRENSLLGCASVSLLQFIYQEGAIPLRLLRLRHSHVRQNITYTCDGGRVDSFMRLQLEGLNGGIIHYDDKTVRVVSQVHTCL